MTQPNDGGPAFPCDSTMKQYPTQEGMSLRDWFAGQALAGYTAIDDMRQNHSCDPVEIENWRNTCILADARHCYTLADAMLKARSQDGN